jgi:hypothetical protein
MQFLPATFLAAILFFPSTTHEQTATSDFSGTWTMDLARSESPHSGEPFKPVTFVIAQSDKDLRIDTTRGDQKESIVYALGKAARAVGTSASGHPEAYWEGSKLVTETQRQVQGYTVTVKESRTLAPGGREMTVETMVIVQHGYSMPGAKNYGSSKDVFVKNP